MPVSRGIFPAMEGARKDGDKTRSKTERGRTAIFLSGLLGLVFLTGCGGSQGSGSTDGLQTAAVVRREITNKVEVLGVVRPRVGAEVKVGSRLSGRVVRLFVQVGDRVKVGDVIAQLEGEELEAELRRTQAALAEAEARLAQVQRGGRPEQVSRARAVLEQAEAQEQWARQELERLRQLAEEGLINRQQLEVGQRDAAEATARLEAARQELTLAERPYTKEDLRMAAAAVDQARAAEASARTRLGYARILAPIAGTVASVSTQKGEVVAAGLQAPTFVTIVDLSRLEVEASVDEVDIGKVRPGQKATITLDAYPNETFEGSVSSLAPKATIQANVVTYGVKIQVQNPEELLKPDMTANVTIEVDRKPDRLVIPTRAIRQEGEDTVVYVLVGKNTERRVISTGWSTPEETEIRKGLREGERVVTDGLDSNPPKERGWLRRLF